MDKVCNKAALIEAFERAEKVLLPKGENREAVVRLARSAGIVVPAFSGRRLNETLDNKLFSLQREKNIPKLLRRLGASGIAGIGFMGSDNFDELPAQGNCLDFVPLSPSVSRVVLAALDVARVTTKKPLTIATSFPILAQRVLPKYRYEIGEIVVVDGSVEAMPELFPDIDAVFELCVTGETLKAHGLTVVQSDMAKIAVGFCASRRVTGSGNITEVV